MVKNISYIEIENSIKKKSDLYDKEKESSHSR